MTSLVSLEEAKDQVFSDQPEDDVQIDRLAQLATGIVMDYVGLYDPATLNLDPPAPVLRGWTEATVPDSVKAAILLVIGELWAHRGDQEQTLTQFDGHLAPHVSRLLQRYREPVVA